MIEDTFFGFRRTHTEASGGSSSSLNLHCLATTRSQKEIQSSIPSNGCFLDIEYPADIQCDNLA